MINLTFRLIIIGMVFLAPPALAERISGRATVIDGDTIAVDGVDRRIRLWGVDAPESRQLCHNSHGDDYRCGLQAAAVLAEMLGDNGRVSCRIKDRDRYRRYVAICRLRGRSINRAIVLRGWALDYPTYSRKAYARDERIAQEARAGVWSGTFEAPWNWRKSPRPTSAADR